MPDQLNLQPPPQIEKITLVGGPGDGESYDWPGGDDLQWIGDADPANAYARPRARYRRSVRTRRLFVYQP